MKSPELSLIEQDPDKGHNIVQVSKFERKNGSESRINQNEKLKEAMFELLSDESYRKYLDALNELFVTQNPHKKIRFDNRFVTYLLYLSDSDIISVIDHFNKGFKDYVGKNAVNIDQKLKTNIFENDQKNNKEVRGNIHESSVLAIVHYIRGRKKHYENSATEIEFYFNEALDAGYKIDILELTSDQSGEEIKYTLNLVQMKSIPPNDEVLNLITTEHKLWVTTKLMSMEDLDSEMRDESPDTVNILNVLNDAEKVTDILIDILTDPNGFKPENFLEKLNLGNLSNKQKAWILQKCSRGLRSIIESRLTEVGADEGYLKSLLTKLEEFEASVFKKAKIPNQTIRISEINSVIAVGDRIVKKINVFKETEDKSRQKILQVN